jgi:hypothetical protein
MKKLFSVFPEQGSEYIDTNFERLGNFDLSGSKREVRNSLEIPNFPLGLITDFRWESINIVF